MHPRPCSADRARKSSRRGIELARDDHPRQPGASQGARSWSLTAALIDPKLRRLPLHASRDGMVENFREAELAQARRRRLGAGRGSDQAGQPLTLNGEPAQELGLARRTVQISTTSSGCMDWTMSYRWPSRVGPTMLIDALAHAGRGLAAAVDRRRGPVCRAASAGHRRRRVRGRHLLLAVFLEQASRRHGRLAGGAAVRRPGLRACCWRFSCCRASAIFGLGGGLLIIVSLVLGQPDVRASAQRLPVRAIARLAAGSGGRGALAWWWWRCSCGAASRMRRCSAT